MKTTNFDRAPWHAGLAALLAAALGACGGGGEADAAGPSAREQAAALVGGERMIPLRPPEPPSPPPEPPSPPPAPPSPPPASSVVAYSSPTGLIASTGNLYWTSTAVDEFGPDVSTVWRAGKDNVPGNEIALYRESGDDRSFGDIVFANPGTFYGYFVAHYQTPGGMVSQIKRVPLTGGSAVVIATSPASGARDLHTDGTTLYWIDGGGIRSVPIGGGAVTTLFADAFVGRISLHQDFVYFGEEYLIMRVPKAGGAPQHVVSTNGRVSALNITPHDGGTWLYWGDKEGGVYSVTIPVVASWTPRTHQPPTPGREVKAVASSHNNWVLWADCAQPGNTSCRIRHHAGGQVDDLVCCSVGIAHLQWGPSGPGTQVHQPVSHFYWGDVSYLRRYGS